MQDLLRICDLPRLVGQSVAVRGWVMTTRSSGKIGFLVLRDGTGYLQAVLPKAELPESVWESFKQLTQEASVAVTGAVRADARAPGGGGLTLTPPRLLGPSVGFPIWPQGA